MYVHQGLHEPAGARPFHLASTSGAASSAAWDGKFIECGPRADGDGGCGVGQEHLRGGRRPCFSGTPRAQAQPRGGRRARRRPPPPRANQQHAPRRHARHGPGCGRAVGRATSASSAGRSCPRGRPAASGHAGRGGTPARCGASRCCRAAAGRGAAAASSRRAPPCSPTAAPRLLPGARLPARGFGRLAGVVQPGEHEGPLKRARGGPLPTPTARPTGVP